MEKFLYFLDLVNKNMDIFKMKKDFFEIEREKMVHYEIVKISEYIELN